MYGHLHASVGIPIIADVHPYSTKDTALTRDTPEHMQWFPTG